MFVHNELPSDLYLLRDIETSWYEPFEKIQYIAACAVISGIAYGIFSSPLYCVLATGCTFFTLSFLVQNYGAVYTFIRDCTRGIYYVENAVIPLHIILTVTAIFTAYQNLYIGMAFSGIVGTFAGFSYDAIKVQALTQSLAQS